jgi:hypothetical protein
MSVANVEKVEGQELMDIMGNVVVPQELKDTMDLMAKEEAMREISNCIFLLKNKKFM